MVLPFIFIVTSALIDIVANMFLVRSQNFRIISWGLASIGLIWVAFILLAQAVVTIDISVAYAMWGAIGIVGTAICGRLFFGQRIKPLGWFGIILILSAILLLNMA